MLDSNRHIISHGKSADSDQQANQQKLMKTFAFVRSDDLGRTTHVSKAPGHTLITLNMRIISNLSEKYIRTSVARTSLGSWKFVLDIGRPSH